MNETAKNINITENIKVISENEMQNGSMKEILNNTNFMLDVSLKLSNIVKYHFGNVKNIALRNDLLPFVNKNVLKELGGNNNDPLIFISNINTTTHKVSFFMAVQKQEIQNKRKNKFTKFIKNISEMLL